MTRIFAIVVVALLTACATPEGMTRVKTPEKVVFRIPPAVAEDEALFSGIGFDLREYECVKGGYKYLRKARIIQKGDESCEVNFISSAIPAPGGDEVSPTVAFKSYIFKIEKKKRVWGTELRFKPRYEVDEPVMSLRAEGLSPPHSLENALELIATSGTYTFRFEIDSPRDSASILKSFRKYLKEQTHVHPVTVMGEGYASSFLLSFNGSPMAVFYVAPHPKRDGTKVKVTAKLHLAPDEYYRVDVIDQVEDIKKLVRDVVND